MTEETPPEQAARVAPLERPDLYVVARFLDKLRSPDREYSKNQLQMAVRLNYDLFRRYLAFLEARGLVVIRSTTRGADVVRLTPKGAEAQRQLADWIRGILGEGSL